MGGQQRFTHYVWLNHTGNQYSRHYANIYVAKSAIFVAVFPSRLALVMYFFIALEVGNSSCTTPDPACNIGVHLVKRMHSQERQCGYNVTPRYVHVTIVAMENQ